MNKRGKSWHLIVTALLIVVFSFTALFGVSYTYGDTKNVYIKGAEDIRFGIDIRGGVDVTFMPADGVEATDDQMTAAKTVIEDRLVGLGITDYEDYVDYNKDRIIVRFPWKTGETDFNPQTAIDEMNHAMDENVKLASKLRFVVSDSAGVSEEELADFSRDIVHVVGRLNSDTFMPLQTSVLSGNCITYRDDRVNELKEVSGNRDVSQGGTTSGLTAASAIAALQEAGSKLSRDMLKSAYRSFAKECYLIIELMRQFYDEQRVFRVTGETGQTEYTPFSAAQLRAVPGGEIGGVQLGDHEPVFDITVSAAKKSTFSRLSQNETAKECYQMGFFAPANADAALAALDMMDFEGIEKVRQRVSENGTLYQQLQQMAQQLQKMAAIIDQQNGTNVSEAAGAAAQAAGSTGGGSGSSNVTRSTTNSLGAAVGEGNNSLSTQAAKRAMDANNPNKE